MTVDESQFRLRLDDLNNRSLFVDWSSKERNALFHKLLSKMTLSQFARLINYDIPTLSEVKGGTVKPSGYVYLALYDTLGLEAQLEGLRVSSRNYKAVRINSLDISPELMGLFHSDGMLKKNKNKGVYCSFCNKNKTLIKRFKSLVKSSFDCNFLEFKDKRDGAYYIHPPSVVGRILINRFGEKKGAFSPPLLAKVEIASYIRGLFDGDGCIMFHRSKWDSISPRIKISMQHKSFAENISLLLSKIGIYSRVQFETSNGNKWWNVDLARRKNVLRFITTIGSEHPKKRRRMALAKKSSKSPLAKSSNISSVPQLARQSLFPLP